METSNEEWQELLTETMDRWREAQRVAQGGKEALDEYLNDTECPLCVRVSYICAHCIVSKILGTRCHDVISYRRLVAARGVEAIAEAIRLMFIDMNFIYDELEGGDTDEEINDAGSV